MAAVIQIAGLTKYYGDVLAVLGLDLEVTEGEIFGFLGPNGAGKSTTQKILIGLLRDYKGSISVFGRDLPSWKSDYYERIGVSFEFPNHYSKLTGIENLKYFASLYSGGGCGSRDWLSATGSAR